jgi:hypothetical protein
MTDTPVGLGHRTKAPLGCEHHHKDVGLERLIVSSRQELTRSPSSCSSDSVPLQLTAKRVVPSGRSRAAAAASARSTTATAWGSGVERSASIGAIACTPDSCITYTRYLTGSTSSDNWLHHLLCQLRMA